MSQTQMRYAQYYGALHYNGAFPIFDKVVENFNNGFWMEFSIKPTELSRTYRVVLIYVNGYQPYSYVVSPNIINISGDRTVPHLYNQENQRLCLTFPVYDEWTTNKLIVNTYIPWIAHWLYYYEEWLLSDDWKGGGKHPGDEVDTEISKLIETKKSNKKKKNNFSPVSVADTIYFRRKKVNEDASKESFDE